MSAYLKTPVPAEKAELILFESPDMKAAALFDSLKSFRVKALFDRM